MDDIFNWLATAYLVVGLIVCAVRIGLGIYENSNPDFEECVVLLIYGVAAGAVWPLLAGGGIILGVTWVIGRWR